MKKIILSICFSFLLLNLYGQIKEIPAAFRFNANYLQADSKISAASLNSPIDQDDRITISPDGHLQVNGKRIRIYGTNLSAFPSKENAEFAAQNLAKQGYNCIRFHHTDANYTNCFLKKDSWGKWVMDPEALDRFDYFFAQLKKVGIYSNLNLLTGRQMSSADGYRPEVDSYSEFKTKHVLGIWDSQALQKQKDWASELLEHVNPYTGLAYKDDAAVAIVEINNENGLLMAYATGWLEEITGSYWQDLEDQWNQWLIEKGYSYKELYNKFNLFQEKSEFLVDKESEFSIENHESAKAKGSRKENRHEINIQSASKVSWHIQYFISGLEVKSDQLYTLKFSAKASKPCKISVNMNQAHAPWKNANFSEEIELTGEYTDYEFTFTGLLDDSNLRLLFGDMGKLSDIKIYLKDISLQKGGAINFVKEGAKSTDKVKTVHLPHYKEYLKYPVELKNLYMNFFWEKEAAYWSSMKDYLKNEVGSKALLMGTILTCSSPYLQSIFDIIDSHAYWYHPTFNSGSWDMKDYYVWNRSLAKASDDNTLFNLSVQRIYGKPFSCSEYDHPYPNQFASEAYLMAASFASYQDWDCFFTFVSNLPERKEVHIDKINGYFDQTNNPVKACAAPLAARIFRQGLVKSPQKSIYLNLSLESELENLYKVENWSSFDAEKFGLNKYLALNYKIGIAIDGKIPEGAIDCKKLQEEGEKIKNAFLSDGLLSDTREIFWNSSQGIYIVSNENLTITVAHQDSHFPDYPKEWTSDGRILPFKPKDDFISCAAVKTKGGYIVFSASWSGNKGEYLKTYGQSDSSVNSIIREPVKLTTIATLGRGPVYALACDSRLDISGAGEYKFWKVDDRGEQINDSLQKGNSFTLNKDDKTLWYFISN
ncbi:MAG: carbohydrate binding domain-containing protein [Treponema sp.]|nr:carbohydrate binding domain-containing protein [Treponema sp.]